MSTKQKGDKNKMEQIDYFDSDFNYIGQTSIDDIHQRGLWHQTVAFWLYNADRKAVYLQLRGPKNRVGANTFDASAGGHLSATETKEDGFRELYEELGVKVGDVQAHYIGYFKNIIRLPNYINNEFCHIYVVRTNKTLNDFVLQEGEVTNLFELHIEHMDDLLAGDKITIHSKIGFKKITIQNMCAYQERIENGYYQKVFNKIKELI